MDFQNSGWVQQSTAKSCCCNTHPNSCCDIWPARSTTANMTTPQLAADPSVEMAQTLPQNVTHRHTLDRWLQAQHTSGALNECKHNASLLCTPPKGAARSGLPHAELGAVAPSQVATVYHRQAYAVEDQQLPAGLGGTCWTMPAAAAAAAAVAVSSAQTLAPSRRTNFLCGNILFRCSYCSKGSSAWHSTAQEG